MEKKSNKSLPKILLMITTEGVKSFKPEVKRINDLNGVTKAIIEVHLKVDGRHKSHV